MGNQCVARVDSPELVPRQMREHLSCREGLGVGLTPCPPCDATCGPGGTVSPARHQPTTPRPQDLSLPAPQACDHPSQSSVGTPYRAHPGSGAQSGHTMEAYHARGIFVGIN
jgi:hypothetical protein